MTPYYDDGQIQIWNADCRDVLPSIDPATVALVLTDPPYGMKAETDYAERLSRMKTAQRWHIAHNWPPVAGDDAPFDPSPMLRYRRLVLFGANYYASRLPDSRGWIVWDKRDEMEVDSTRSEAELAWTNLGSGIRVYRHKWFGLVRDSEIGKHLHPTQKPVALMRWILSKWSKPGDLILDPYMGSGPVARACLDLGRRYVGIELSEAYCAIAVSRLSQQVLPFDLTA